MMSITPFQPNLPAEVNFTDAEIDFIENSPIALFPENQDSNLGLIRKIHSDRIQELIDQLLLLYNERFVDTSVEFLDVWEQEEGLPVAPTGMDDAHRRVAILSRIQVGLFTRTRRRLIVEAFVIATFGAATSFGTLGVPITPAGITLYSGVFNLAGTYTIVENTAGFSFAVHTLASIAVDLVGLRRELDRITPAGISFTVASDL